MRSELITTLKRQTTELLSDLERNKEPILITQHGVQRVYLVDVETYEALQRRMNLLEGIVRGEKAVEEGRTLPHSCAGQETHESMAEVIWSDLAHSDLDGIVDYIAVDNPGEAKIFVRNVFPSVGHLVDHPQSGFKP